MITRLLLLAASAVPAFAADAPEWMVKFVLGPYQPRLREFDHTHPEIRMTMGHMDLKFFDL